MLALLANLRKTLVLPVQSKPVQLPADCKGTDPRFCLRVLHSGWSHMMMMMMMSVGSHLLPIKSNYMFSVAFHW